MLYLDKDKLGRLLVFRRFNDWLAVFVQTVCQYLLSVFVIRIWCNNWSSAFDEDQYLTCKTGFMLHQDLQSGNGKSVEDMTESFSPEDQLKIWKQKLLQIQ